MKTTAMPTFWPSLKRASDEHKDKLITQIKASNSRLQEAEARESRRDNANEKPLTFEQISANARFVIGR
ncbi:MAG: hypothetical protein KGJ35_00305 [Patescibacteria group bacterium]|nr:hypothetical protein [Patescibacteria group bacterium]